MGLLSFVGNIVQDVFGGSQSRSESNQYSLEQMRQSQQYNLQNMEIQQGYTQENMALQNQYNIDAFNRENAYNSPLAQKQRNYAAGINPNWQDGAGVVAQQDSGVSPSGPGSATPGPVGTTSSPVDPTSLLDGVLSLSKFKNEQDNLKAQTRLINSQVNETEAKTEGYNLANYITSKFGAREAKAKINEALSNALKNNAEATEITTLLEARKLLLEHQGYKEFQLGQKTEAEANTSWNDYYHYDELLGIKHQEADAATTTAGAAASQAKTAAGQLQENIRHNKITESQQDFKNRIDAANGRALRSLYKMESELTEEKTRTQFYETTQAWLNNNRSEIENTILEEMQEQGIPIAERRAQIQVWKEDAKLKQLEQEFEKAKTATERRRIYFDISDRLIELMPKVSFNYHIKD